MKKQLLTNFILLSFLLIGFTLKAQIPSLEWAIHFEGTATESGWVCHVDEENNLYTAGLFNGTVDFDPGSDVSSITSYNPSSQDMYITKMDLDTNLIWAKRIGGPSSSVQSIKKLLSDSQGNIYVFGSFSNNVDFDPGDDVFTMTSSGGYSLFLCKLDTDGNFIWAKKVGTPYAYIDYFNMALDSDGNAYMAGTIESFNPGLQLDLNPGDGIQNIAIAENWKMFLIKLDSNGEFIWGKNTSTGYVRCNDITVDASNNILVVGGFSGSVDFGMGGEPNTLTSTAENAFIIKLTDSGDVLWTNHVSSLTNINLITADSDNNIFTGGYLFFRKYDLDGNFLWGYSGVSPLNLVTDSENSLYLNYSVNNTSLRFYKYSSAGVVQWNGSINGVFSSSNFTLDDEGHLYITGRYNNNPTSNIDFDPSTEYYTLPSFQGDAYICKWSQPVACAETFSEITYNSCDTYFEYNGEEYWETGIYQQTLENAAGCDSIVTINLQLNISISPFLGLNGTTLYTVETGYSYQWVDCNSGEPIEGATSQTFTPTQSGEYQLHTSTDDCTFESLCYEVIVCDEPTFGSFDYISCEGSYNYHGQVYLESGTYEQTITNSLGCDSIVTLNLQLGVSINATVTQAGNTLMADESGFYYQWLDCDNNFALIEGATSQSFTPQVSGNYSVEVASDDCSYSSTCFEITVAACTNTSSTLNIETCENSYSLNEIEYFESGEYEQIIPNAAGCDSTITLNLTIEPLDNSVTLDGNTLTTQLTNAAYQWIDCDNNNNPIADAELQSYTPLATGNYAVEITLGECSNTSPCISVTITSVEGVPNYAIDIFPNPTNGIVNINGLIQGEIEIVDLTGRAIFKASNAGSSIRTIDLSSLSNGIYFLLVKNEELKTIATRKIILEK